MENLLNTRRKCETLEDLFKHCSQVFHSGLKGGILLKDMDSNPTGPAISRLVAKMKKAKFSALRDIAKNLGAKEEILKKIYAEKNKSAEMIKHIAVLQVAVNDSTAMA